MCKIQDFIISIWGYMFDLPGRFLFDKQVSDGKVIGLPVSLVFFFYKLFMARVVRTQSDTTRHSGSLPNNLPY
jgi:hypothetical protein